MSNSSSITKRRKRRTAWSDPTVKRLFDKQRSVAASAAEQAAANREAQVRQELSRLRNRAAIGEHKRVEVGLDRGLRVMVDRFNAVKASKGFAKITVSTAVDTYGSTGWQGVADFSNGTIKITVPRIPEPGDQYDYQQRKYVKVEGLTEVSSKATVWDYALHVRGILYHELGHHEHTMSFKALAEANGITDLGTVRSYHRAWNTLEDQRMERLVVRDSPIMAAYLTALVKDVIPASTEQSWSLLAGRKYLPVEVRNASKAAWCGNDAEAVNTCVENYITALSAEDAWTEVLNMHRLLAEAGSNAAPDNHGGITEPWGDASGNEEWVPGPAADEDTDEADGPKVPVKGSKDDEDDEAGNGEGEESDDEAGDEATDGADAEGGNDADSTDGDEESEGSDGESDDDLTDGEDGDGASTGDSLHDAVDKAVKDALDELGESETFQEDIRTLNSAVIGATDRDLPLYPAVDKMAPLSEELDTAARLLSDDIRQAFETNTADLAPVWQTGLRRGILDPIRYVTRAAGDLDYRRAMTDVGNPSLNVKVTLILDVSVSMGAHESPLGMAAWAVQKACVDLGIRSKVLPFESVGYILWDEGEVSDGPTTLPVIGGTDPEEALRAALADDDDITNIVIVMTDGQWGGNCPPIDQLAGENDVVSLFLFGLGDMSASRATEQYGATAEVTCSNDLADIPRIVERLLVEAVK